MFYKMVAASPATYCLNPGVSEGRGQGGQLPPQILVDQKAPPGSGGAPHYYLPPRIFDPCCTPDDVSVYFNLYSKVNL